MFCHECGKQNPDGAKFCAYCGMRLIEPEARQAADRPEPDDRSAPAPQPAQAGNAPEVTAPPDPQPAPQQVKVEADPLKPDPHYVYRRPPSDGQDVRPILENPAQPVRGAEPKPPLPAQRQPEPKRDAPPAPKRPQPAVTSSGGEVMPPARAPNVKKPGRYDGVTARKPGASPFAQIKDKFGAEPEPKDEDDLFFEDDEPFEEEDAMVRHLKSIIAVLFLVLVVGTLGWLFLSASGQLFRASVGIAAPADAYFELAKQREANSELKGAAEAYFNALKLDPDNYLYAMQVGISSEKIGNNDRAIQAYRMCIDQRDNLAEPYRLLAELLDRIGNTEAADQWRRAGYEKTGDESLIPPDDASERRQDIVDAVPAQP